MTESALIILRLSPVDNVAVACCDIAPGMAIPGFSITPQERISKGHKVALEYIESGAPIRRYGQIIGFASKPIAPGFHVHVHNVEMRSFPRDHAVGIDARPTSYCSVPATFHGIRRADGRVATRNYLGVVTTVNCSATVARAIASRMERELRDHPTINGVVPITHNAGCGMAMEGEGMDVLRRTLVGYARHPNFAGVLLLGLGCEDNQLSRLAAATGLGQSEAFQFANIQDKGGTAATIDWGVDALRAMVPHAEAALRAPMPAAELRLALECGGSDGYSGITANPALGAAADLLVAQGGTAILSETPEIYGAEHLLTRRAVSAEVADRLLERIAWWEDYTARNGGEMNNNPSPGNKAGGLTTILEKSLGAVAKGGSTNLVEVYRYADSITTPGLVFMDTPGYDPVAVTGQVAGGANVICFTTGRGSVFGAKPAPCIKLATNTPMYERMTSDMDLDCGPIVDGNATVAEMGAEIFDLILRTASGEKTKSEILGLGDHEFAPWTIGATM